MIDYLWWGLGIVLALVVWWVVRLIWFKPVSINHFYERVFFYFALQNPELLSMIGILEQVGLNFHNDDLTDLSDAQFQKVNRFVGKSLNTLRSYDRAKQTPAQLLSTDILDWFLEDQARAEKFMYHDYPVNQMFGVQNELPKFFAEIHRLDKPKGARYYIKRLSKVGVKFDQVLEGLRIRESKGVIPPRFVIHRVLEEMRGFIGVEVRENIMYTAFKEKVEKLDLGEGKKVQLYEAVERGIRETVYPAYQRLIDYFEYLEPKATTEDGVWKLPDGEAYYAHRLRSSTTTEMTPDEVHETGLSEVARIQAEMDAILKQLGHTQGSVAERMVALGKEARFLYPNTDEGRAQAMEDYQAMIDHIDQGLDDLFDIRPKAGVKVERVPEFSEKTAPGAYYNPPAMDGSRPGIFYANLRDMNEVVKFDMRTLAYHEAVPGHHFQIALAQELKGLPMFRRMVPFTAYVEGWALYSEKLAREHGFMGDRYSELGCLKAELFRAVRLVVDTGIHQKRWTREEAIAYMEENTGMATSEIVTEVERYIVMPGQACSYKVGMLKVVELREKAMEALGDKFEIKAFHNVVLKNGAMPLSILEQLVDAYIGEAVGG